MLDRAQVSPSGGSGDSWEPIISPDGRYVLFASMANNLVLISNNPLPVLSPPSMNVFLRDRLNGTTTLVSMNLAGSGGGNGDSFPAGISTNGRYALFESSATNLVAGDTNNASDIFIRDVLGGVTVLVSASTNGGIANGPSRSSVLTPNGSNVVFVSAASNLVPGDTNGIPDVFVRDWQAGVTTLASVGAMSTNSALRLGSSETPDMTPDGRYVAFLSTATNLVAGLNAIGGDVYVRDLVAGTSYWASASARAEVLSVMGSNNTVSFNLALSTNGQFVAYEASPAYSRAGIILRYNLQTGLTDVVATNATVPPGAQEDIRSLDMTPDGRFIAYVANTNGTTFLTTCIRVWDALSGTSILVSGDLNGNVSSNSTCDWPTLDSSGRFVAFLSNGTNMVTNSLAGDTHLYLRDTQAATTTLIDADTNGVGSMVSPATSPRLSADGSLVAFECPDGSLVPDDRNHDYDTFVRNLVAGTNELISAHDPVLASLTPNGISSLTTFSLSTNGCYIAFASDADNLVSNDTNGCQDVFVRDLVAGTNILVSVATNGIASGDGCSTDPAISANGRYVAFASGADNLTPGDTNQTQDVFLRDLQAGTTLLVSVNMGGAGSGNGASYSPVISADGNSILFRSKAENLTAGTVTSGSENLFFRSATSGTTYALTTAGVSSSAMTPDGWLVAFVGAIGGSSSSYLYVWNSQTASRTYTNSASGLSISGISPDGTWVVYSSSTAFSAVNLVTKSNLVIGPALSPSHPGLQFSKDGRYLAYAAVSNYTNQVYLCDFQTGTNLLLSQAYGPSGPANGGSDSPTISPDGRFVAYRSGATNIVAGGGSSGPDLFLYDQQSGVTTLLTASRFGGSSADNRSLTPIFSADGQTLVFQSWASDLVAGDFNHSSDVFAYPLISVAIIAGSNSGQNPILNWPVIPGLTYHVQFKNNLLDPNWQDIGNASILGNRGSFTDAAPALIQRFYRISAY